MKLFVLALMFLSACESTPPPTQWQPNPNCQPLNRLDDKREMVLGGYEKCTELIEHKFNRFFERVTKGNVKTKLNQFGREIPSDAVIRSRFGDAFWVWEREESK